MTGDRRLTPFNGRVARDTLRGQVAAEVFTAGTQATVAAPLADLCASPGGARDRQLLMGAGFRVLDRRNGHAFGQADDDGYVGWVPEDALGPARAATHAVAAPATHLYPAPDIKRREAAALSFGARLTIRRVDGAFAETAEGLFVHAGHIRPVDAPMADPAGVAALFLGTPYLWGGNSRAGIDCSGLVQAALLACAIPCPGDSDLQERVGVEVPGDAPLVRGDLVFWRGHVGIMADADTLLHANAHAMSTVHEPIIEATARIAGAGGGPVTTRRRPSCQGGSGSVTFAPAAPTH